MNDGHLIRTAKELAEAMNRLADDNLPTQLAGIVKLHAGLAVGSALIPIPGADMAAAAVNIWTMYVRVNRELALPFGDNIMKSLAAGVATNLAGGLAGAMVVGSALKFLPGLGTIGGAVLMGGTTYAITIASGIVYMKAITMLLRKDASIAHASEADLRTAADEVMKDKSAIASILKDAKQSYRDTKK
jgi:uncharacterized protein (DUF697 family)